MLTRADLSCGCLLNSWPEEMLTMIETLVMNQSRYISNNIPACSCLVFPDGFIDCVADRFFV